MGDEQELIIAQHDVWMKTALLFPILKSHQPKGRQGLVYALGVYLPTSNLKEEIGAMFKAFICQYSFVPFAIQYTIRCIG